MGGSSLGAQAIYDFLKKKIKKKFSFIDNLQIHSKKNNLNKHTNLNNFKIRKYIETIVNATYLLKKKIKIFLLLKKEIVIYIT